MLKFVSNAGDFGDVSNDVASKSYTITQNTIQNSSGSIDRIRISKNPDYIDLADYLVLTRTDRLERNKNDSVHFNKKSQKVVNTQNDHEVLDKNKDFYYNDGFYMVKSDWLAMNGVMNDDWGAVVKGYENICRKVKNQPSSLQVKSLVMQVGNVENLKELCGDIKKLSGKSNDEIFRYFMKNFAPYMVGNDDDGVTSGVFTGYYYPTLNGSRKKSSVYKYPIYKKPVDLTAGPYFSREDIANGVLNGKGLEIFWVDNIVDLFFLHIQGSGLLKLAEGGYANVRFAAKNNQPYVSIGQYMVDMKYIKKGQDAREFLKSNPRLANEIMNVNKSYIFFEESFDGSVVGAHGSDLVDGRSLAVDSKFIPYGLMLYLDADVRKRVMYSQDTGSAIKGKIRGDIFVGKGFEAGEEAKKIYAKGVMYVLVYKNQKVVFL